MRRHDGCGQPGSGATHHWLFECSRWLSDRLGARLVETPGGHVPQLTHAAELVDLLRPMVRSLARTTG
ncbi:hypothetical protein [Amycolatopsis sp. NPDC051371]|uniref:hypothetical protein n=1 Tax=Amycolatopsis sp. NPDC051371 TaxID=3155800 RepID=UPI00342606AE